MSKTIGILGGMGPYATLDLFEKILLNTPAEIDQDHLKIIINNNPKIPSRKAFINQSESPLNELIKSARLLEEAGADFIIMPCHTAHLWWNEVKETIKIPFYSMVENTVERTISQYENRENKNILFLATGTTVQSQIYQNAFKNSPFQLIIPTNKEQEIVDQAIKSIKAGLLQDNFYIGKLKTIIDHYHQKGVSLLIGCCTEIPLMYPYFGKQMEMIDPTLMLAIMAVKESMRAN